MFFSSENYDGAHPAIIEAIVKCNNGFEPSYGKDKYSFQTIQLFKTMLNRKDIDVFFCFNGTGANNFAIGSVTEKYSSVFCSDVAHIYRAESTAPETFIGSRLFPIRSYLGKMIVEDLQQQLNRTNGIHLPVPAVVTISQPTEYGTVYSADELKKISRLCKQHNVLLHIDGARIFNALDVMNCTPAEFIKLSGVDLLTLGGTKAGLLFGEAVIFFKSSRFKHLAYHHKRSMQLASKNRFIAAQFSTLFKNDLWKQNAAYTNELAKYFEKGVKKISKAAIVFPVETNAVFMKMTTTLYKYLQNTTHFYRWDEDKQIVRFIFSINNTKKEIDLFLKAYQKGIEKIEKQKPVTD